MMLKKEFVQFFREIKPSSWLLIIIGSLSWSLTMVKSGLINSYGMGFWGPNGHDGVWHIALAESLAKGSWQMPIFAGESIKNYHIGFDVILAILHKVTFIPTGVLYFQILPVIFALLIGIFAYKLVFAWKKTALISFWATFFVYFGGSWGWIVTLFKDGKIGGESMFWSQQSISTLVNPPFALSLLIIFVGLYFLIKGQESSRSQSTTYYLLSTFLFGILIQIKVYAGILILAALFVAGVWRMFEQKGISVLKVFCGAAIVSILLFFPFSEDVGKTIIFKPFWFLETMMSFPDRVGWMRFGEAMVNYKLAGNWVKSIPAYLIALFIFWFGNLGTRIIKDILVIKRLRELRGLDFVEAFIYPVIFLGFIIPMFFIQSGTPWNTIQFMYYSLMFSGILAGVTLGEFLEKAKLNTTMIRIIVVGIILLTVPITYGTLKYHYLPSRPPAKISKEELEAIYFLKSQPDGVVLTLPFDKEAAKKAESDPPRQLYLYESTAYVSAFSGKPTYLEDEVNLEITRYKWRERRELFEEFLITNSVEKARLFLEEADISYIYWVKDLYGSISENQQLVKKIYENEKIQIFRFDRS